VGVATVQRQQDSSVANPVRMSRKPTGSKVMRQFKNLSINHVTLNQQRCTGRYLFLKYIGWAMPSLESIEQCKGTAEDMKKVFNEGCQIYGYMEVNRVSGSFHIAPGKSFSISHVHGTHHYKGGV